MNFVYALTENIYEWLLPSIRSLADHHKGARVFILCEHDTFPLELPIEAEIINVKKLDTFNNSVNYNNYFKYINLFKVCYASLLPVNKVIHLDVDTIIADDLSGFWKTDVSGKWFAACKETYGHYKPFGPNYYNMGVALLNLYQMRKDHIEPELVDYLNNVRQPWADQDAWNKYGIERGKIADLELRYNENQMTGYTDNPAIVHFCAIGDWFTNQYMDRREYLDKYRG